MIPNIAWFTPRILAWRDLETDVLFHRGQFSWELLQEDHIGKLRNPTM